MKQTVRAIVINRSKKVLFVQHNELDPRDQGKWATIGGRLEQSDVDLVSGLIREISEEFGTDAACMMKIGPLLFQSKRTDRIDFFYYVKYEGNDLKCQAPEEIRNQGWFGIDELKNMNFFFGFEPELVKSALILDSELRL